MNGIFWREGGDNKIVRRRGNCTRVNSWVG